MTKPRKEMAPKDKKSAYNCDDIKILRGAYPVTGWWEWVRLVTIQVRNLLANDVDKCTFQVADSQWITVLKEIMTKDIRPSGRHIKYQV